MDFVTGYNALDSRQLRPPVLTRFTACLIGLVLADYSCSEMLGGNDEILVKYIIAFYVKDLQDFRNPAPLVTGDCPPCRSPQAWLSADQALLGRHCANRVGQGAIGALDNRARGHTKLSTNCAQLPEYATVAKCSGDNDMVT